MTLFLSSFLSFILLYKYWGLFLIAFSSAFILPIPENTVLVACGAFASQGYMNVYIVILITIIGTVLADCFGFFLTYRYGNIVIDKLIPKWDKKIFDIEKHLRNYAFGTIFLTKIAGPFAPYVNFLSGLIGVPFHKFLFADILGNAVGDVFFVLAGYILGNYWQLFIDDTWLASAVVFVIFIIYIIYKTMQRKKIGLKANF